MPREHLGRTVAWVLPTLALIAWLVFVNLGRLSAEPFALIFSDPAASQEALVFHYAFLPRLIIGLLAGAALGLSGVLFQQLLQNPLAAADTLGINAGAQLSLTIGLLLFPVFYAEHPYVLGIGGAFLAWLIVAALAGRRGSGPMTIILTGFVTGFVLGALATLLMLLNQEYLTSLLIWGAGSLAQSDWAGVEAMSLWFLFGAIAVALLARPLLILGFGDKAAGSIGVSLKLVRPALFGLAIVLSGSVAATTGVIGFVGLAAPHLARVLGAETLSARLVTAPIVGALLLTLVDQALLATISDLSGALPTGAITALLGAPILIALLRRLPRLTLEVIDLPLPRLASQARPSRMVVLLTIVAVAAVVLALAVGRGPGGFYLAFDHTALADWRWPRVVGAAAGGLALGLAGCLIQRLVANPMASPEILGIGGGVAVGLIVVLLASATAGAGLQLAGGITGALVVAAGLAIFGRQREFAPERLLLVGIAVTALLNACAILFLALGDARVGQVLAWLSGSTYRLTPALTLAVTAISVVAFTFALPFARWLEILPLGGAIATGLGIPVHIARPLVLALATIASGAAAMVIGPMSFIGLIAPHVASGLGLRRAGEQMAGAALSGLILVVCADWVGRVIFAPTELPAGLLCVFLGAGAYAAIVLRKGREPAAVQADRAVA